MVESQNPMRMDKPARTSLPIRLGFSLLFLLLLVQPWRPAAAVTVDGLYVSTVPVETRDRPERQEAFKQALSVVLVRMTGARSIEGYAELDTLVETAGRYVQRFEYSDNPGAALPYLLRVSFDGKALERAITDRGLPVWGQDRPGVLVWVGVAERGSRYLLGDDGAQPARAQLDQVAADRGLALLYPVLDVEDQSRVKFADISGGFHEAIREASRRYRPEAILVGYVSPLSGGYWQGRWTLYQGDQPVTWTSEGASANVALAEGAHQLAATLASRTASQRFAEVDQGLLVVVEDIRSHAELNRVNSYLAGLAPVSVARPFNLQDNSAEFLVKMRGSSRDLARLVMLGDVLVSVEQPVGAPVLPGQQAAAQVEKAHFRFLR